jgi:hypothetical protein
LEWVQHFHHLLLLLLQVGTHIQIHLPYIQVCVDNCRELWLMPQAQGLSRVSWLAVVELGLGVVAAVVGGLAVVVVPQEVMRQ